MLQCDLDLGDDPWERLSLGHVNGAMRWNGGRPVMVAARIRGAHSRRYPKKSLQVDLPRERLEDGPPAGHTVRRIHLNADYIDPTLMRSALSYRLFEDLNVPGPRCRHAALTVSGEFAGVYVALESVDSDFCRRRGWAPGPIFYAVNRNANFGLISPFSRTLKQPLEMGYKPVDKADAAPLRQMIMDVNLASDRALPRVADRWLDVPEYLRWLAVAVFVGNRDGFVHNYALYLNSMDRKFRIIPWDYDATWGIDVHGRPARLDRVPLQGWNKLTHLLFQHARYRRLYKAIFLEALAGPLAPEAVGDHVDDMRAAISPWLDQDRHKTGTPDSFPADTRALRRWAELRRSLLLNGLAAL
ncbi:MAG TPA: CotH kinase family protein [Symbiobacteriaceae bacterium]|jgi:spore coat protein H